MKYKIVILFGEMGSGKNYHGEILAKENNIPFFDGDTVATPEMIERVKKFKPLTRKIISDYVSILAYAISDQDNRHGLVVAQALYSNEDRLFLKNFLEETGYSVSFVWIKSSFWRNLKQIYSRENGLRWVLYWLMNKPFFQKPTHLIAYSI